MKGAELREHRMRLGLTQKQMAERVGVHSNSLARMERDEMTISEPVARLIPLLTVDKPKRRGR
jgi:transcriptional regulator with XRE-family HTH domain